MCLKLTMLRNYYERNATAVLCEVAQVISSVGFFSINTVSPAAIKTVPTVSPALASFSVNVAADVA